MQYRERGPGPRYIRQIRCYWSLEDEPETSMSVEPVVPDGCPEIVFNLAARFRRYGLSEKGSTQPRSLVSGQLTKGILIGPTGSVDLFGVRFQPAGAFAFLRHPLSEMTDRIVDLAAIIGNWESLLYEKLAGARSFESRIAIFEQSLHRFSDRSEVPDELVHAVSQFSMNGATVGELSYEVGWSIRRLERQFEKFVGVRPKMFSRIARFRRLMGKLEVDGIHDLADAALACGYFDQSHMNHEFKHFTGFTPLQFMDTAHRISGHFVSGDL
ncbi:MAG TPA: helix-turn-helix domain-containing protein [Pyrinomonadaceae bacterium]|nr:helix-turn-helix domain-containing protein [Pyrinomonadaceae bacterium]